MRLNPSQRAEAAEYTREANKRQANWNRCTNAKLVVTYLEVLAKQFKKALSRERVEQLAWQIESHCQEGGNDLDFEATLRIHAYVDNLISKE